MIGVTSRLLTRDLSPGICRNAGLGRLKTCYPCRSGSHHATYRATTERGDFAIRIGSAEMQFGDWERHARLASLGIAPRLLCQGYMEVDDRVFGYEIGDWLNGRRFDYERDLQRLADTLAILHRRTRNQKIAARETTGLQTYLRHHLQWYLDNPLRGSALAESMQRAATTSLALLKGHPAFDRRLDCLVHNDLVPGNIIVTSEGARLIDWDWAVRSHPALDLCGVLSPFATSWEGEFGLQFDQIAAFLDHYLRPFSGAESRIIMHGLLDAWQAYNAIVANWTYRHADHARPHFRDAAFYRRSFAHAAGIWAFLRAQSVE